MVNIWIHSPLTNRFCYVPTKIDSKHHIWLHPASSAPPYSRLPLPGHLPGQFTPMHPNTEQGIMVVCVCGGGRLTLMKAMYSEGESFSDRPAQLSFHTVMIPCSHFSPELVSVKRTRGRQTSQALRSDDSSQTDQFTHITQQVGPVSQRQTPLSFFFTQCKS